ncbi:MAG: type II toxin-antitoxin system VapC family toxin [Roseibium sp.]|nr:type II toxin-antitoxin system VapC family toxin [Roseibium sp.]
MADLLLDTCAVIWTGNGDPISEDATQALNATFRDGRQTLVSPFTAWELGMLVARARLRLTRPVPDWFDDYIERGQLTLAELSPRILVESSFLPGKPPADPADRIILATARAHNLKVITRDTQILAYAEEGHVNAIAC